MRLNIQRVKKRAHYFLAFCFLSILTQIPNARRKRFLFLRYLFLIRLWFPLFAPFYWDFFLSVLCKSFCFDDHLLLCLAIGIQFLLLVVYLLCLISSKLKRLTRYTIYYVIGCVASSKYHVPWHLTFSGTNYYMIAFGHTIKNLSNGKS